MSTDSLTSETFQVIFWHDLVHEGKGFNVSVTIRVIAIDAREALRLTEGVLPFVTQADLRVLSINRMFP